jgi:hypothetical protein
MADGSLWTEQRYVPGRIWAYGAVERRRRIMAASVTVFREPN